MTERGEAIKAERRRRRSEALGGRGRRLGIDESLLDREKYVYRWANDDKNRIHELTEQDDYEIVRDKRITSDDVGTSVALVTGTQPTGAAMKSVLLRKLKEHAEEDDAAKARQIDDDEAAIRQKPDPKGGSAEGMYVPGGKANPTEITRGRGK